MNTPETLATLGTQDTGKNKLRRDLTIRKNNNLSDYKFTSTYLTSINI
jgi:hypothetical protein